MCAFHASWACAARVILCEVTISAVSAGGELFIAEVTVASVGLAYVTLGGGGLDEIWA